MKKTNLSAGLTPCACGKLKPDEDVMANGHCYTCTEDISFDSIENEPDPCSLLSLEEIDSFFDDDDDWED